MVVLTIADKKQIAIVMMVYLKKQICSYKSKEWRIYFYCLLLKLSIIPFILHLNKVLQSFLLYLVGIFIP